jgi:hypothetical protein
LFAFPPCHLTACSVRRSKRSPEALSGLCDFVS